MASAMSMARGSSCGCASAEDFARLRMRLEAAMRMSSAAVAPVRIDAARRLG